MTEPPNQLHPQRPDDGDDDAALKVLREDLAHQFRLRGIGDERVLGAIASVPRHRFVLPRDIKRAYQDRPLPISYGQTISQPYIVAFMTAAAQIAPTARVLEIGTGSGYQTAILAELAATVYSVERVPGLSQRAQKRLQQLGYGHVHLREGDGYRGWPEPGPYDAIVVTAAPPQLPPAFERQLVLGGRLVIPVGDQYQDLLVLVKTEAGLILEQKLEVSFVPLVPDPETVLD
jgi:protein-L-isoaspartate(D-aspartate) O-methyltransferase